MENLQGKSGITSYKVRINFEFSNENVIVANVLCSYISTFQEYFHIFFFQLRIGV